MYRFIESIRFENGSFSHLRLHQQRMDRSREEVLGKVDVLPLENTIKSSNAYQQVQDTKDLFKCRLVYSRQIESVEFIPYRIPKIQKLKLVFEDQIKYDYKYLERQQIEFCFQQRGEANDVLIVKDGLITDTSFANVVCFNGKQWITPAQPLLKGIQRQYLLDTEQIIAADIQPADLSKFQKIRLINAMIRFEDSLDIEIIY